MIFEILAWRLGRRRLFITTNFLSICNRGWLLCRYKICVCVGRMVCWNNRAYWDAGCLYFLHLRCFIHPI